MEASTSLCLDTSYLRGRVGGPSRPEDAGGIRRWILRLQWFSAGLLHALVQMSVLLLALSVGIAVTNNVVGLDGLWIAYSVITIAFSLPIVVILGGALFGLYLFLSNWLVGMHEQEVVSVQGADRFKSFLRMRITTEGLDIFVIGAKKVCTRWCWSDGVRVPQAAGPNLAPISEIYPDRKWARRELLRRKLNKKRSYNVAITVDSGRPDISVLKPAKPLEPEIVDFIHVSSTSST